jgi:hypothetical protein
VINLVQLTVSLFLEVWISILLLRRRVQQHFPLFVYFLVLLVPVTAIRLVSTTHYHVYFYFYWWSNAALTLLGLAALHQVFRKVYEGFYSFWWFRVLYFGVIILVLVIAILYALFNPAVQADRLISLILAIGIAVNLLQAGIAALFGALSKPFAVEMRRYPLGIAAGFAASSLGPFIGYLMRSVFGNKVDAFTKNASAMAYIVGLFLWLITFFVAESDDSSWTPPLSPEEMLSVVREYWGAVGRRKRS